MAQTEFGKLFKDTHQERMGHRRSLAGDNLSEQQNAANSILEYWIIALFILEKHGVTIEDCSHSGYDNVRDMILSNIGDIRMALEVRNHPGARIFGQHWAYLSSME